MNIDLQARGSSLKNAPAGYILPITSKNIKVTFAKIVDKDLKAVYGIALGVPTVSEEEFIGDGY